MPKCTAYLMVFGTLARGGKVTHGDKCKGRFRCCGIESRKARTKNPAISDQKSTSAMQRGLNPFRTAVPIWGQIT